LFSGPTASKIMRPINELRMRARWKLGGALAQVERAPVGRGKKALTGLTNLLGRLGLSKPTAMEAQRIGTMPDEELSARTEHRAEEEVRRARQVHDGAERAEGGDEAEHREGCALGHQMRSSWLVILASAGDFEAA
jgi:hypothetical protein